MKKLLLFLIFLVAGAASIIPYWTGIVVEQQFEQFHQSVPPMMNVTLLNSHYERLWLSSQAVATFEMLSAIRPVPKGQHFTLVHQIDHGLLPIKSTQIDSLLSTDKPAAMGIEFLEETKESKLLEAHTRFQNNGDVISMVTLPALRITDADTHARLHWQNSQGQVSVQQNGTVINIDMQIPQLQLDTDQGQRMLQNIGLAVQLQQQSPFGLMEGRGKMTVAELRIADKHTPVIKLEGVNVTGHHQIDSDNLTVAMTMTLQQMHVGEDYSGPGSCDLELRHLHTESLGKLLKALLEGRLQGLSSEPFNLVRLATFMQDGVTLLNNAPEVAITHLSFETQAGKLQGALQVKLEEFDASSFFNPWLFLNTLTAQVELHLPEAILSNLIKAWLEWSATTENTVTPTNIKQRIQTWLSQGILVKAEAGYYSISIQLKQGILHTQGQHLPITTLLQ